MSKDNKNRLVREDPPEPSIDGFPIRKILIVDDEESLRLLLIRALTKAGFVCEEARTAEQALEIIGSASFDLVISDIAMPGMDGVELMKTVKAEHPEMDFIIMTGHAAHYSYVDIMDAGASDYMTKPFRISSTLARIKRIAREKRHILALNRINHELRKAMDQANKLALEAKKASRAKTYFLAAMSHEIRTPLNGIVGYTDMLMDTPLDTEQHAFLTSARLSCDILLNVVNDILDFSKVESGRLKFENIPFDPEVLCFDVIDALRTQVDETRVDLICRISDQVPSRIEGDPHRFRQVLLNLLGNAVKFTPQGSIAIEMDAGSCEDGHTLVTVCVADTGIGIAPEFQESIFDPFIQTEGESVSHQGGTGLGLAISRDIARKMGGDIWVASDGNQGSRFFFKFKTRPVQTAQASGIRPADLKGRRLVLATGQEDRSRVMALQLEKAGLAVEVYDLADLADLAARIRAGKDSALDFDMGIIDLGKSIRPDDTQIPLIQEKGPRDFPFEWIACAVPFQGIARILDKAGFSGFIPKPVRRASLLEMTALIMGRQKSGDGQPPEEILTVHSISERLKTDATILLVEDNPVNQKMTCLMMTKAGYQVIKAEDGQQACDVYQSDHIGCDLILMDINMPVMDGFTAARKIRKFEKDNYLEPVPILALTANVLDDFKQKCLKAGMNDFLTKPIKREVIFSAIQKWVRRSGQTDS